MEFALVVPIVFSLFFVSIELTWLNMVRNTVSNAAYEAARKAAIPNTAEEDIKAEALKTLHPLDMDRGMKFEVIDDGTHVAVTIMVPISENSWGITSLTKDVVVQKTVRLSKE